MDTALPRRDRHRIRISLIVAVALTIWFAASVAGLATPVLARTCGTITVELGTVSPGTGTTETTFAFSVTVRDTTDAPPQWVRVRVAGAWSDLAALGPTAIGGAVYRGYRKLPVGTWPYSFRALSSTGTTCDHTKVAPSAAVVSALPTAPPPPTPTPTPTAKPTPTAPPTPTPTPTPMATPKPTPTPTPTPTNRPGAGATARPVGGPASRPTAGGAGATQTALLSEGQATPTATPTTSPSPASAVAGPLGEGSDGGGFGTGLAFDLSAAFPAGPNPLVIWLVTTVGGAFLLLVLLRRAQSDDGWSKGMALGAASTGAIPVQGWRSWRSRSTSGLAESAPPAAAAAPMVAPARTFDRPPADGAERAKVGYHGVRISSQPNPVHSASLGRLDRGDEVEILDSYEGFLQVRTPDDITGWIPRHTIVGAPAD